MASSAEFLKENRLMWLAMAWNIFGFTVDEVSSRLVPLGWIESNPMSRGIDGRFIWSHALAYDWLTFATMLVFGLLIYFGLRLINKALAQVGFSALFLYEGFGSLVAATHNLWVIVNWYVPDSMVQ